MKRIIAVLVLAFAVSGCASITGLIPSFWDSNQSSRITDVELAVHRLDCAQPLTSQVAVIRDHLEWFVLYSKTRGSRNKDVIALVEPLRETTEDFYRRAQEGQASPAYCGIKQRIMTLQAHRAAQAIQGRF